ncbi:hypothetical protein IC216_06195 [Clostridioides sp. ES-S-0145-01]|uniref:hypothetical protein n=1 Tax=Clostridioides sp. ES-S-0145-01 TaxID=2770784 RepID=UPI001D100994|nr:hypothetical protein [Clostridioides sp. ES-S-0145-01]
MDICKDCFHFKHYRGRKIGRCNKKERVVYDRVKKCKFYKNRNQNMSIEELLSEIERWSIKKINSYVICFDEYDSIKLDIVQDYNRPNNPEDDVLIEEYIENNYGYVKYEIIILETVEKVEL